MSAKEGSTGILIIPFKKRGNESTHIHKNVNGGDVHGRAVSFREGTVIVKSRWRSPYKLVYKDPLLTYLLVFVPSILTLR